ncbi:ABC transporter substrate-binding protein [Microbacterium sp. NPDC056044]|uniref:ABC transporter substrate-binding protein n=1 Tax=Microbacterium sp. NPDC056044 TaxID=3345690 RepID=UPI0035E37D36
MYDTLIKPLPDGTYAPGLALDWSYDDALTALTLDLRTGVTFTDGATFDAEAVVANIAHFKAGSGLGVNDTVFIDNVEAVDEDTVVFHLSEPDPGLIKTLSGAVGAMASPDALDNDDLDVNPVGSGPYTLDASKTTAGAEYVYTKKKDGESWDADSWKYDTITLKVMGDVTARVNGLLSGEIDGAAVTPDSAEQVKGAGLTVIATPSGFLGMGNFDRNGTLQPALADVRVRQAISYAFDREELLQAIGLGYGEVSQQLFGPGMVGHDDSLDDTYSYDVDKAKELMAEAGYADGFDVTMPDLGGGGPAAALVQQDLAAIGIRVTYEAVAPSEVYTALFGGKYPMNTTGHGGTSWDFIKGDLEEDGVWNMLHATDPELTALIETARNATEEEQPAAYAAVNRWVTENAWYTVFYQGDSLYATQKDIASDTGTGAGNNVPYLWTFAPTK